MIQFDSKTKRVTLDLPDGEPQLLREVSSIIAVLRDELYVNGHTVDEVNNLAFAAFRMGMEDTNVFPHSEKAKEAIAKLSGGKAKSSSGNRELPV